jgi:hypothetical protein
MHVIYTFPGPGVSGVPPSELAAESDSSGNAFTPGQSVGLPLGTTTGPYIIVYTGDIFRGSTTTIEGASLIGPAGLVELAIADGQFLIPRRPLAPLSTYVANVTVRFSGERCMRAGAPSWSAAIPPCPADIPPFCEQDPQIAALLGRRVCDPGEVSDAYYTFPDEVVTHQWGFQTGSAPPRSRKPTVADTSCRPTLTAPARLRAGSRLVLRYRTCGAATIRAELYRATRARQRRLARASAHWRRHRSGRLVLSTRRVPAGHYLLRARMTGARHVTLSRRITVVRSR